MKQAFFSSLFLTFANMAAALKNGQKIRYGHLPVDMVFIHPLTLSSFLKTPSTIYLY